jgi:hypothetical protein
MADEEKKLLLAHRDKLRVADRDGSCAAWSGIDQRHLTEDGIVGQSFEHAIADADLDLAVLNDEQLIGIPWRKMTSPALNSRTGTPAPANIRKSIGASVINRALGQISYRRSLAAQNK